MPARTRCGDRPLLRRFAIRLALIAGVLCSAALAAESPTGDRPLVERVRSDVEWLAGRATRVVGTADHDRTHAELLDRIRAVAGVQVWTHRFGLLMPHSRQATLTIESGGDGDTHRVHPMWPAAVRLCTTPEGGISGRLMYVGEGQTGSGPGRIPARSLRGQIAVIEAEGGSAWQMAARAGAAAILVLGSDAVTHRHLSSHLLPVPVNIPRFYVPDGPLAERLRRGAGTGRLDSVAAWADAEATNIYALVPAATRPPEPQRAPLVIAVSFDAAGIVPSLAAGADAAVDVALALDLLRSLARNRPVRPVLFAFIDGYTMNQLGMRQMLGALALTPDDRNRRHYTRLDRDTETNYRAHRELVLELDPTGSPSRERLAELRTGTYRPLHRYVKDEVARDVVSIERDTYPLNVARFRLERRLREIEADGGDAAATETTRIALAEVEEKINTLKARRARLYHAQAQLIEERPLPEPGPELDLALSLWRRARRRTISQHESIQAELAAVEERDTLRRAISEAVGLPPEDGKPIAFLLGLDLSDAGIAAGPSHWGAHLRISEKASGWALERWLKNRTRTEELWPERERGAVDLGVITSGEAAAGFVAGNVPLVTAAAQSFRVPGTTWTTLEAPRWKVDSPADRPDRLDWERLGPQLEATETLVRELVHDPAFAPEPRTHVVWGRVDIRVVDQATGEPVPRLPMNDYLVTLMPGSAGGGKMSVNFLRVTGVRRLTFRRTAADGRARVDLIPGRRDRQVAPVSLQAYNLADDGRIVRSIDMNRQGTGVRLNTNLNARRPLSLRGMTFDSDELTVMGLFDSRFLVSLLGTKVLDAAQASPPQRLNCLRYASIMSCQLKPETAWQVVLQAGIAGNRMALLNLEADPSVDIRDAMAGFPAGSPPPWPLHVAAKDFYRLDRRRLRDYRDAGIENPAVRRLQRDTRRLLRAAERAEAADDAAELLRAASGAMSREVRAYQAVRDTADDVVRGAIFLMLLLVPFAYALERLVFASAHVYRQLAYTIGIFALMTAILWLYHPAFDISSQPAMIIMAFAVIFMSLLVLSVVYAKFRTSLEDLRSGRAEASGARTSRAGVLSTALRLGIANMRRRPFRTFLTGTTVVLITFALLCFMSTSSVQQQREFRIADSAPYTGLVIRQPGQRAMPVAAMDHLQEIVGEERLLAPRFWRNDATASDWHLHVRNPANGKRASLLAALGVSAEEYRLTGIDAVCPNWDRFVEQGGCYLPPAVAEALGVQPGDPLVIAGQTLHLLGVTDPVKLDELRGLAGESILPLDYSRLSQEEREKLNNRSIEQLTVEMTSSASLEPERQLSRVPPESVVIVPEDVLRDMPGATLRSVSVRTRSAAEARGFAREMAERLAFPIYFGTPDGVDVLAATPLVPRAPKSLLIPLVIGGLIIFNTMLSSIAERRKEIYIYTSLGLAPLHVGFLFLAEAITYGLMGSVFGYVVGQGVATVLGELGWLAGLQLNYSGTQAIFTMVLVLGVVIVSSLVPAFLAGKLAAPSNRMRWTVPEPVDGVIRDRLPFTVTQNTANGVMTFLREFLDAHREGSIGHFSTDNLQTFTREVDGQELLGLVCTVWLAPYDLGIRQDCRIEIHPMPGADEFRFQVELTRRSGQESSWKALNRTLLGDLRRQLLGWRNLKLERMLEYIAEAKERLGGVRAPAGPTDRVETAESSMQTDESR
jgi:hypothetical protein